jgi:hypothetical protein
LSAGGCDRLDRVSELVSAVLSSSSQGTVADEATRTLTTDNIQASTQRANAGSGSGSGSGSGPGTQITAAGVTVQLPSQALANANGNALNAVFCLSPFRVRWSVLTGRAHRAVSLVASRTVYDRSGGLCGGCA